MKNRIGKILIVCLGLFILLISSSVIQADDYTFGNYYHKQLTTTTAGQTRELSISGRGDKIIFRSNQNIGGLNPGGNKQIFLWTSSGISRITPTGSEYQYPSISFDGNRATFTRDYILDVQPTSLFLWTPPNTLTEIATGWTGYGYHVDISNSKISGNGKKVVFKSVYNLFTEKVDTELYLWEEGPGVTTTITSTQSVNAPDSAFSVNYDGSLVAFSTKENKPPFNTGNDNNFEIYMCNSTGSSLTQITSSSGGTGSKEPSITSGSDWTKIAFSSDRNFVGNNADGGTEIFLWTLSGTYSSTNTGSLTQITSTPSGKECRKPQISKDGKFITFYSNADITGGNPDGNYEVFVWNINGTTTQVTSTSGGSNNSYDPVIGSYTGLYEGGDIQYGPRIAYYFNDGTKDNIFLATSTIAVPATSRWGLIILVLLLAALALFILKRRRKSAL
jgi:Tol biopolymer transport system component